MADAAPSPAPAALGRTTVDAGNPWPGLEAFREADAAFFFGRERPSADLTQLLVQQRLVVLYGRSGLGKTSLLRAGVFPRLREARLLPVYVRIDFRALGATSDATTLRRQLKAAIEAAAASARVDAPSLDPEATPWEWLYRTDARFWNERSRKVLPVLVFDQFEEAFTHGRRTDAIAALTSQFLGEIVDVVRGSVPATVAARLEREASEALAFTIDRDVCHVLLSLRKEFLPELLRLRSWLPTLLDHRLELRGMTHEEAARVVTGPGRDLVEPGVETLIVEFVAKARRSVADQSGDETMVDPAILSVFCRELNRRRPRDGKINATLLEDARDTIIAEFYADSVKDLGPDVQTFIEDDLITESGYRNSVAVEQALLKPGVTREVIDRLIDRRLLRSEGSGPEERLELTHDVLADPILARRNTRREREAEERNRIEAEERLRAARQEALEVQRVRELEMTRREASATALLLETKRRANVRQRWLVVGLIVLAAALGAMYSRSRVLSREVQSNLARAHVEQAMALIAGGRHDQGLAYVAAALRVDKENVAARSLAIDAILHADWPLPIAQLKHGAPVVWAEFDRASSRVVTGSADNTARIWRIPGGEPIGVPLKHNGTVLRARFSPDASQLLTVASDGAARLWDVETGTERRRFEQPGSKVTWAALAPVRPGAAPADPLVVTGADDGTVCVWTGSAPRPFKAHEDRLVTAQFSPDGAHLLTASADRTAGIWNWQTGRRLARLFHPQPLTSAQFSADGTLVVTASQDGSARIWAAPSGRLLFTLAHDPRVATGVRTTEDPIQVTSVQLNPEGTAVVTAGSDGVARLWDVRTGASIGAPMTHGGAVMSAVFAAAGRRLITASTDQTARIWNAETGRPAADPLLHDAGLQSASFSRDMQYVVTAADDNAALLWDVRLSSAVPATLLLSESPALVRFAPNGRDIVFWSAAGAGSWATWDGSMTEARPLFDGQPGIRSVDFSRDGTRVLRLDGEGVSVSRWPATGEVVKLADKAIDFVRMSPDGSLVITGAADGAARIWNAATGALVAESNHSSPVTDVQFGADGTLALSRTEQSTRIWRARTGQLLHEIAATDSIVAVRFAQAPALVVTVSTDAARARSASLTDITTGALVAELKHETPITGGGFSPDGQTLYTLSGDGKVKLWQAATGTPIATITQEGKIGFVEFSRDGQRLVTGSSTGTVRVWDAVTGQAHSAPLRNGAGIEVTRFSPDGQRILSVSTPEYIEPTRQGEPGRMITAIRIWDVPVGAASDAEGLSSLIQAFSGYQVSSAGAQTVAASRFSAVTGERAKVSAARDGPLAARLRSWAFGDRARRTIDPFTAVTIDEFVRGSAETAGAREAILWFPWHPGRDRFAPDLRARLGVR